MGNKYPFQLGDYDLPLPGSMGFLHHVPTEVVNTHRVGRVYILVHKPRLAEDAATDLSPLDEKRAHHSLLIDVAGASNPTELHGVSFHLTAAATTRVTEFCVFGQPITRASLIRCVRPVPDRLRPPVNVPNPREWARQLDKHVRNVTEVQSETSTILFSLGKRCLL
jgi:hypothetical protein